MKKGLLVRPRDLRLPLYAGLGVAAMTALITTGLLIVSDTDKASLEKVPSRKAAFSKALESPQAVLIPVPEKHEPVSERVAEAFEAATGHRQAYGVVEDGKVITTRPLKILQLSFGPVLLTEEEIKDGCHACVGAIGVFYLKEAAGTFTVTGRWPRAVTGWTWGYPPTDWHVTKRFTANPAIYASGGFTAQGITTVGATITELNPSGPVQSDVINTSYDDDGAHEEGEPGCLVEGRIANIRRDKSFDLIVTGSVRAVDRFVKRKGRFVALKRIRSNSPCDYSDWERSSPSRD